MVKENSTQNRLSSAYYVLLALVAAVLVAFSVWGMIVGARQYLDWLNPMASPEVRQ